MKLTFSKYQGAGNDFIIIDATNEDIILNQDQIERLCDRRFGIGADGLIILKENKEYDFQMIYYNSDGRESSMCGNGGRCIVRFANDLGIINTTTEFLAIDGLHKAEVKPDIIELNMINVPEVEIHENHIFLNTGSPHHIIFSEDISKINVKEEGAKIRYGAPYFEKGSNVNFVQIINNNTLNIRTYERGVEDETLACGTGVTAAAIAAFECGKINTTFVNVNAKGGKLSVNFEKSGSGYSNVWLNGPAKKVYNGEIVMFE